VLWRRKSKHEKNEIGRKRREDERVVPRSNGGASSHHLSDRDTLTLTTGDTTNEGGSDLGVLSVWNSEHAKEEVQDFLLKLLAARAGKELAGGLEGESEEERLSDGEGRSVDVVLYKWR
jgi:hypothetical protein